MFQPLLVLSEAAFFIERGNTMDDLKFIQIRKDDADQFEICKTLWIPFIQEVNSHDGKKQTAEQILDGLKKRISIQGLRKDMHFEIAYWENIPVGISMFAIDLGTVYGLLESGYGTVMGFYIRPECRRQGLGSAFWNHIEATLYADGATKFYICPDSVTGIPFWQHLGFVDSGKVDPDDKKPIYIKRWS